MWSIIANQICEATKTDFRIINKQPQAGGEINRAFRIDDGHTAFFVKLNEAGHPDMFRCEWNSLDHLGTTNTLQVPTPICSGSTLSGCFLVLDYFSFNDGTEHAWYALGQQLAALHQSQHQPMYGWDEDNFLGLSIQPNTWHKKWSTFFAEQRIGWQLTLLEDQGIHFGDIDDIVTAVKQRLIHHQPSASLLHGDLWRGNVAFCDTQPVIFDPASYFGDRETDIAMTELFGQFPHVFYQGYNTVWPLDSGYQGRRDLYNLYHLLNHVSHFGEPYREQASSCIYRITSN